MNLICYFTNDLFLSQIVILFEQPEVVEFIPIVHSGHVIKQLSLYWGVYFRYKLMTAIGKCKKRPNTQFAIIWQKLLSWFNVVDIYNMNCLYITSGKRRDAKIVEFHFAMKSCSKTSIIFTWTNRTHVEKKSLWR